ncbi:hypothetical protein [Sphaerisporangium perillae]|uniref:hypothetical protein n=1 Tax=Sphaerisporangium perillae TaxID=2935860 RepID=UPI00200F6440|nr:hypothetical protein [Sphaerisporangium perillae]
MNLGPTSSDIKQFEEWRGDLLTILAVHEFGHDSPHVTDVRKVVDLANRYAEVGAPLLFERLSEQEDLAVPKLYLAAEIMSEVIAENIDEYSDRTY